MFNRLSAPAIMAMITAALQNGSIAARNAALHNIPEYKSRGKGSGKRSTDYMGRHGYSSMWKPNGGKECERRRRQIAKGMIRADAP